MNAIFQRLTGFVLLDPALLWLLALVPLALWLRRRGGRPALRWASVSMWAGARSLRVVLLPLPPVLTVLGLACATLALARPVEREALAQRSLGLDILLCLDVSSSMTQTDMARGRSRLDVARDAATEFIRGRPDDRIGLVTFARYADLRCPLTRDADALGRILADVETVASDGPEDATGFGAAIARAAQVLAGTDARSPVVILLTDGEENVGLAGAKDEIPPAHAAQLCERLGVRVYAIAAGEGRRDSRGRWVKIDTRPLEELARRTGGGFHVARDAGAVSAVYARIDALEKAPFEEPRFRLVERFLPFLLAALGFLLVGRLLGASWLAVLP